jgi:hypothetical protein
MMVSCSRSTRSPPDSGGSRSLGTASLRLDAYALRDGEDTILVDPLVAGETEPLLAALDEIVRGSVRILVTLRGFC